MRSQSQYSRSSRDTDRHHPLHPPHQRSGSDPRGGGGGGADDRQRSDPYRFTRSTSQSHQRTDQRTDQRTATIDKSKLSDLSNKYR